MVIAQNLFREVKETLNARLHVVSESATDAGPNVSLDYDRELLLLQQAVPEIMEKTFSLLKRIQADPLLIPFMVKLREHIDFCLKFSWAMYLKMPYGLDIRFFRYFIYFKHLLYQVQRFLDQQANGYHFAGVAVKQLPQEVEGTASNRKKGKDKSLTYRAALLDASGLLTGNVATTWNMKSRYRLFGELMNGDPRWLAGISNARKSKSNENPCRYNSDKHSPEVKEFMESLKKL